MTVATTTPQRKRPFKKIMGKGWETIRDLSDSPIALKVWSFIAEHADYYNSLVCTADIMAEELGCHERSIRRATRYLESKGYLVVIRLGSCNAFVIDAEAVWANIDENKRFCAFNSKTLARVDATLKKRLTLMIKGQPDLFDEEDDAEAAKPNKKRRPAK